MSFYRAIEGGVLKQFNRPTLMDFANQLAKFFGVNLSTPLSNCHQDVHELLTKLTLACEWLKNAGVALIDVENIIRKMADAFGPTLAHKLVALKEAFEAMSLTYVVHLPYAASKIANSPVVGNLTPYGKMIALDAVSHCVDFQPLRKRFGRFERPQMLAIAMYLEKPFRDLTTEMCFELLNDIDVQIMIFEMADEIAESERRGKGDRVNYRGKGGKGDRVERRGKGGKGDCGGKGDRGGSWRSA